MRRSAPNGAASAASRLIAAAALICLALGGASCHKRPAATLEDLDPIYIEVDPSGELPATYYDAFMLLQQGNRRYAEQQFAAAEELYRRLLQTFPSSEFAGMASYNLGLSLERQERWEQALEQYLRTAELWPGEFEPHELPQRSGACLEQLGRWDEARAVYAAAAALEGVKPGQRIKLELRAAVAQYYAGQAADAKQSLRLALERYDELSRRQVLDAQTDAARAWFVLGEAYYDQFSELSLAEPMDQQQLELALEDKARLLLLAKAQYLKAIRIQQPEWMTASMYKIGLGYYELRQEILAVPLPPELAPEQQDEYRAQLLEAVEPLRSNAMSVLEKNLRLARQLDIDNEWVRLTREIYAKIAEEP